MRASSSIRCDVFSVLGDIDAVMISGDALGGGWWRVSDSFKGRNKYFVGVCNVASQLSRGLLA